MSSKLIVAKFLSLAAVSFCLTAVPAIAQTSGHDHDHATVAKLSLNAGNKWATDAPLRTAMSNIRNALDASLKAIHEDKLSAAKYAALAKTINSEVANIVSNCKLEPKADAQLHLIIAEILEGAEVMDGKLKQVKRQDGAVKVIAALGNYGSYFDDPGWKPVKH